MRDTQRDPNPSCRAARRGDADLATHEEAVRWHGLVVLAEGILIGRARLLAQQFADARIAIVPPFLPDQSWQFWSAMQRNRTILGLNDRLVVIEASERGGTMSAGQDALKQGKPTWVLDHADPPESAMGNRLLIEQGGQPIPVSSTGEATIPAEFLAEHGWVVNILD